MAIITLRNLTRLCCAALAAAVIGVACAEETAPTTPAQPQAKLVESTIEAPAKDLEKKENALTLTAAADQVKQLQKQVEELQAKSKALAESLAQANLAADQSKEDAARTRQLVEALGLAAITKDQRSLQIRLLDAVNDYRISEKNNAALTEQVVTLSEAAIGYMKTPNAASKAQLEKSLAAADRIINQANKLEQPVPVPLSNAKVVSFKTELGLAVLNAGKLSGLHMGMPLSFVRKDQLVAAGVVVDCRDQIAGVLVTSTASGIESVTVGDTIKIEPNQ